MGLQYKLEEHQSLPTTTPAALGHPATRTHKLTLTIHF